jgi:CTP:molybdopterin cytidylyltransferase MocA
MGSSKQLLPLGPKPVIRHCLDGLIAAGIQDIVVVLGIARDGITAAISGLPVRTIINGDPASDMAGSVRLGLGQTGPASSGVLVCPADHPLVSPGTITAIIQAHHASPDTIIIPMYDDRRGHPTLFPRAVINDIVRVATLRDVIAAHAGKVRMFAVQDEGVVLDLDTPEDYERAKGLFV